MIGGEGERTRGRGVKTGMGGGGGGGSGGAVDGGRSSIEVSGYSDGGVSLSSSYCFGKKIFFTDFPKLPAEPLLDREGVLLRRGDPGADIIFNCASNGNRYECARVSAKLPRPKCRRAKCALTSQISRAQSEGV